MNIEIIKKIKKKLASFKDPKKCYYSLKFKESNESLSLLVSKKFGEKELVLSKYIRGNFSINSKIFGSKHYCGIDCIKMILLEKMEKAPLSPFANVSHDPVPPHILDETKEFKEEMREEYIEDLRDFIFIDQVREIFR